MAGKKGGGHLTQFATRAIHVGQEPESATGAVTVPIFQTSTFAQSAPGVHKGYDYSRTDNPTRTALQTALASLEEAEYCLAFSSGMGAATTAMLLFKQGDHVVSSRDVYGGTYRLFRSVLRNFGLTFSFVETSSTREIERAMTRQTRLVWIESPTNPAAPDYRHPRGGKNRPSTRSSLSCRQHLRVPLLPAAPWARRRSRHFTPRQNTWRDMRTWSGEPSALMNPRSISGSSFCKMRRARRLHPSIAFSRFEG